MIGDERERNYVPSWRQGTTDGPALPSWRREATDSPVVPSRRHRPSLGDEAQSGSAYANPWRLDQDDQDDDLSANTGTADDTMTAVGSRQERSPQHDVTQSVADASEPWPIVDREAREPVRAHVPPAEKATEDTGPVGPTQVRASLTPPRSVNRSDWENAIYNCPDVDRGFKFAGIVLSRSADFETGRNAYPSQASIAAKMGYTKTGPVSRALQALRDDGWLYREGKGPQPKGGGRPNDRYRLTEPKHDHRHDGSALPRVES